MYEKRIVESFRRIVNHAFSSGNSITVRHPTGRVGYSNAIDLMIDILTEYGLYNSKNEKRGKFKNVYYSTVDSGGKVTRCWEKLEYEESEGENDTDV